MKRGKMLFACPNSMILTNPGNEPQNQINGKSLFLMVIDHSLGMFLMRALELFCIELAQQFQTQMRSFVFGKNAPCKI